MWILPLVAGKVPQLSDWKIVQEASPPFNKEGKKSTSSDKKIRETYC